LKKILRNERALAWLMRRKGQDRKNNFIIKFK
jgi:hypothetical protein